MKSLGHAVFVALSVAVTFAAAGPLAAAVLNVDTVIDDPALTGCDDAVPNDCSLRGAITKANGLAGANTINVPAGSYVLTQNATCSFREPAVGSFVFPTTSLCLSGNISLLGAGAGTTTIDGNHPLGVSGVAAPVLFVSAGATVEVRAVSLVRGNFSASIFACGGGIRNAGTLSFVDSVLSDNVTTASGGGLCNAGNVTLVGSVVTRNSAVGLGGAIVNTSGGMVTVANSTLRDNFAGSPGGGIDNLSGTVTIDGSTIADNVSYDGEGGGVHNGPLNTVVVTNSTVSGNRARFGGGIYNSQGASLYLNNVTIANNTARWFEEPTRGAGGGLWNQPFGTVTLRNTLIASNVVAETDPDCFAMGSGAFTSQGYNLIQDTSHCDIAGSTTGNIVGQDPKLGLLADNGGPTLTHALGTGSPAIDAGSPSAPGSGGTACAVADQRQFLRPLGARCDIGAAERSGAFALTKIAPPSGGNVGSLSAVVAGSGFLEGANVLLRRTGQPDIAGDASVDEGGQTIAVSFDLNGRSAGLWDVVVVNPGSVSRVLPAAFSVQTGGGPALWVQAIGTIRGHGHPNVITIMYGNRGNVDAIGVPILLRIPQGYSARRYFEISPPPANPGQVQPNWFFIPPIVGDSEAQFIQLPLLLPIVPAGYTGTLRTELTFPQDGQDSDLLVVIDDPRFTSGIDAQFVAKAVSGSLAYAQANFGSAIPASLVPQMQQYYTAQLQQVIANGKATYIATGGSHVPIYSIAQLQLDLALYGALRSSGTAASAQ